MALSNRPKSPVKTVDTSFELLEALHDLDGATLSELAEEVGLALSTVHRHLRTLHHRRYVVEEAGEYHVSLRFLELGTYAQTRKRGYRMAKEKVEELAAETDERAQFLVEEHGRAVYVYRETGCHAVKTDPGIGKQIPLHTTSAGKAILAHLPRHRVEEIFDGDRLSALTAHTKTDPDALFEEFEDIRARGYSVNDQENIEGLRAIGVPVKGADGSVLGALSISGPTHRMKGDWFEEELPNLLLGTSNELELNIAHS